MARSASSAVPGKTFTQWRSLLSPSQQVVQQHPEQPTAPLLRKRSPWAQVCNNIFRLRTDLLTPGPAGKSRVRYKECPGSPCGYRGHPAPQDSSQGLSAGTHPSLLWHKPPNFVSSVSPWQIFPPPWAERSGAAPHLSQVAEPSWSLSSERQLPPLVFMPLS